MILGRLYRREDRIFKEYRPLKYSIMISFEEDLVIAFDFLRLAAVSYTFSSGLLCKGKGLKSFRDVGRRGKST